MAQSKVERESAANKKKMKNWCSFNYFDLIA